jgi:hypothetical protein
MMDPRLIDYEDWVATQRAAARRRADSMLRLGAIGLLAIAAFVASLAWYEHSLFQDCLKHHAEANCVQYE